MKCLHCEVSALIRQRGRQPGYSLKEDLQDLGKVIGEIIGCAPNMECQVAIIADVMTAITTALNADNPHGKATVSVSTEHETTH